MKRTPFRVFSYGGWIGDPGEIAAALARKHQLCHAVWLDRVESKVILHSSKFSKVGYVKSIIKSQIVTFYENRAVRRADLALLHGATVYDHFRKTAKNPQLAEDIHLQAEDRISDNALTEKLSTLKSGPLQILYCGRADPMKGGYEWIQTLIRLKAKNSDFHATWVGDGSLLEGMKTAARSAGLTDEKLSFLGFVEDRHAVLDHYRKAHVFMFCHLTDESPRNLIESLHAATPLVGFRDRYAASLVNEKGAGDLVDRGDIEELAQRVNALAEDREQLAELVKRAADSASHLTRDRVFKDRSDLIRHYLDDR
jgi:glycosyltransferase involved in cell wall biosynthesis